ncbi:MAG TPA: 1-deoxy-D-xylulose-5-phosphate synthase [Candidatus Desulfofervidus auxilii]|uniref:1-deoxy-D-xylulose-5-phosphate synthase n=1 Tax=Desulfofervidus auxilii TaxID=1621989 RepID=A0A7V0IAG3_DESA2|nr:1-deoxy-D-xylulose-5-phosphate synthase [Candidatus Desulfofervidus auxilii]
MILERINSPADLKNLNLKELETLAKEIRQKIIETVSKTGGHLAPSLGAVELALALHYVFDTPKDKIIWDVGHQSYAHKLITGRKDKFHTLRQFGGISGFPRREESPYDAFGTGHASTSISAALGMAIAQDLKGEKHRVIAVIGDGAMTGGLAFEALNHAGELDKDLIVVLNDNTMSISPNVGALSRFLSHKLTGRFFRHFKKEIEKFLLSLPAGESLLQWVKRSENSLMSFFTPGMLFLALHFDYLGPINGHNLEKLIETFQHVKKREGPILVHVLTIKGKGYEPAEKDPTAFHGVGKFSLVPDKTNNLKETFTYTKVFAQTLVELAKKDKRIVGITAAMPEGTGLSLLREQCPEQFFDVGIAEEHAVTMAAGMAAEGMRPVVTIYSTFLQRAFDQIIHDVCLQKLPVVFAIDRAGIVGEDGPTHHGAFDLSYLRIIPHMVVMAPKDENELRHMLKTAVEYEGPIAIRYPRGKVIGVSCDEPLKILPIGEAELLEEGEDILILAIGQVVWPALEAVHRLKKEGFYPAFINARFVKPLDENLLKELVPKFKLIVTIEENALAGGFGSAVLESISTLNISRPVFKIGLPDIFVEHGAQAFLRKKYGLDTEGIYQKVKNLFLKYGAKSKIRPIAFRKGSGTKS